MPGYLTTNVPDGELRQTPPPSTTHLAMPAPETAPFPMFDAEADTGRWVKAIVQKRDEPGMLGRQVYAASAYVTPRGILEGANEMFPSRA